ncbi:MAG TPA: DMT family transporter [Polyangiaceae bacterium]|nr:DMT family transporter [Polyangiaceae bacterium]
MKGHALKNPIAQGTLVAVGAAVLFGLTTPLVKHFGSYVGAFATATLLYAGAALGSGLRRVRANEPRLTRQHAARVLLVAVCGAVLAPAAFAWGLQRSGALATSLLLNLEAAFTVALARLFYREPLGKRVLVACALMMVAGLLLALRMSTSGTLGTLGLAAVCVATIAWALDNTLTRPLADLDPRSVVFWKAATGAALSVVVALLVHDDWPSLGATIALLVCGATGYGLSIQLYLSAQRRLGAGRTGSLFALAPFVGATLSFALGDRSGAILVVVAASLFAVAIYLHGTEKHGHRHLHQPLEHEHAHTHDDGHHTHEHDPPVTGSHSHRHRHGQLEHDHPHGEDVHHRHGHE